jgi:DNA-binding NarL/FixJ family response regulator
MQARGQVSGEGDASVRGKRETGDPDFRLLTEREVEVLLLLPEGETDRILARRLGIAERTVRAHVTNIKRKLGFRSRMEAALVADRRRSELLPKEAA